MKKQKKRTLKALHLLQGVVDNAHKIVYTGVSSYENGFFASPRTSLTALNESPESFSLSLITYKRAQNMFDAQFDLDDRYSLNNLNTSLSLITCEHSDGSLTRFDQGNHERDVESAARYTALRSVLERKYEKMIDEGLMPLLSPQSSSELQDEEPVPEAVVTASNAVCDQKSLRVTSDQPEVQKIYLTFSELCDAYFAQQINQGYFEEGDTTLRKYRGYIRSVIELIGEDIPANELDVAHAQRLRESLAHYPCQRFVGHKANMLLDEIFEDDSVKILSGRTAAEYFSNFKKVINFAYREKYIAVDFARDMDFKINKKELNTIKRLPFTDTDLRELLSGPVYNEELKKELDYTPAHFWVPLIAMFSGMRLNEISQLHICDVCTDAFSYHGRRFDVPHFMICSRHPSQTSKNPNAERLVPIHEKLIEIGFLDYLELRRRNEDNHHEAKLFADVFWQESSKWGRLVGRWFNGDTDETGYKNKTLTCMEKKKKPFHSFRHLFVDLLRLQDLDEAKIASVVGHEGKSSTSGYGNGYQLPVLQGYVNGVIFSDEVEDAISALKNSPYNGIKPRLELAS